MSGYTKGPWGFVPRNGSHQVLIKRDYWRVGSESCRDGVAFVFRDEANARLISAAPELLEALKAWNELLRDSYADMTHVERDCFDAAKAAIAKAEGK